MYLPNQRVCLAVLFAALLQSGCALTSSFVSSIGARSVTGTAPHPPRAEAVDVVLQDFPRVVPEGAVAHFAAIPYVSLAPDGEGRPAGGVVFKPAEVQWSSDTRGQVTLMHDGAPKLFDVSKHTSRGQDFITLDSHYREWYGYPAQGLLVLTLPLDVVIDVLAAGGVLVSLPFVYGVRALQGESVSGASKTGP